MERGLERAIKGYTLKDIFDTKLRGEPFELTRKTLVRDMFWLVERDIFAERIFNKNSEPTYVCKYPVRIWHTYDNDKYLQTRSYSLKPNDIWAF